MILYEYPFNERTRSLLRIEHLVKQFHLLVARSEAIDHHFALATLFELVEVGSRPDLSTDLLKEIDKQKTTLAGYRGNPAISESVLDDVTRHLNDCFRRMNESTSRAGQNVLENDWLTSIRTRIHIAAGTCGFDLPSYHAWQHASSKDRQMALNEWFQSFSPMADSVSVLLQLLRDSGMPQRTVALGGQFQQTLPQGRAAKLLRLQLDPDTAAVPEISGNRLIVSIRFMRQDTRDRLKPLGQDVPFEFILCT